MLKSLLVGLDGSEFDGCVLALAREWAGRFQAQVVGCTVLDEPGIRSPEPVPLGAAGLKEHRDLTRLESAGARLQRVRDSFLAECRAAGIQCQAQALQGIPADRLMTQVAAHDLVLLGQKTHFRFATQSEPDDTLRTVIHASPRPVVAVPCTPHQGQSIVVAYDGSLQSARTLAALTGLGLATDRQVHLLGVHSESAQAEARLETAREYLSHHGIPATLHAVATDESVASVILQQAANLNAGLLVLGAFGQPVLREIFLGSVTRTILAESPIPVFLSH